MNSEHEVKTRDAPSLSGRLFMAAGIWSAHAIALAVLVGVMIHAVPQFERLFEDFEVELSPAAMFVLQFSQFVTRYWYLLVAALILVDGPIAIGVAFLAPRWHWVRTTWLLLPVLATLVAVTLIIAVMFPLVADIANQWG